jgi:hypothetical protein
MHKILTSYHNIQCLVLTESSIMLVQFLYIYLLWVIIFYYKLSTMIYFLPQLESMSLKISNNKHTSQHVHDYQIFLKWTTSKLSCQHPQKSYFLAVPIHINEFYVHRLEVLDSLKIVIIDSISHWFILIHS